MSEPWSTYKFTFEIRRGATRSGVPDTKIVLRGAHLKPASDKAEEIKDALPPPYNHGQIVLLSIEQVES